MASTSSALRRIEAAATVGDRHDGSPATQWTVTIQRSNNGCCIREQFRHLPRGLSGLRMGVAKDVSAFSRVSKRAETVANRVQPFGGRGRDQNPALIIAAQKLIDA